jgi:hypothetical protein
VGWLIRTTRTLTAVALATVILAPLLPGPLGAPIVARMRQISVLQTWNMYAPDPQRAQSYLAVSAELADGTIVPLEEAEQAEHGWDSVWDWQKRRIDIWRIIAVGDKPSAHRSWYLRGVCVREARTRELPPRRVIAERVRRRFASPEAVAAGKPTLGEMKRAEIQRVDCNDWPARGMIAADRERRGLPPLPGPPPRRAG